MQIISSYFNRKKGIGKYKDVDYSKLKKVFENSLQFTMPDMKYHIYEMKPPRPETWRHDLAHSSLKVSQEVLRTKELTAVCDIDLMFLRDISDIQEMDFDIAITKRNFKAPINSGVWFYRPGKNAENFVNLWIKNKLKIMKNYSKYEKTVIKAAGINQGSLVMTIEELGPKIKLLELPCVEWNATQTEWKKITDKTRIIHIKSEVRKYCLGLWKSTKEGHEYMVPLVDKWKSFLKEDK